MRNYSDYRDDSNLSKFIGICKESGELVRIVREIFCGRCHDSYWIRYKLIANEALPFAMAELLLETSGDDRNMLVYRLVERTDATADALFKYLGEIGASTHIIIKHPNVDLRTLKFFLAGAFSSPIRQVFESGRLPPNLEWACAQSPRFLVREQLAQATKNSALLAVLANDPDAIVRAYVAVNPATSPAIVAKLALHDEHMSVRKAGAFALTDSMALDELAEIIEKSQTKDAYSEMIGVIMNNRFTSDEAKRKLSPYHSGEETS